MENSMTCIAMIGMDMAFKEQELLDKFLKSA